MDLQNFVMEWAKNISGISAVAIIGLDGSAIAGGSFDEELDIMLPSAYFTEVIKSSKESLKVTNWGDFEDVLITSATHYIVMRVITNELYFAAAVNSKKGNLGSLRLRMKTISKKLLDFWE